MKSCAAFSTFCEEPLVSVDFKRNSNSSIVDAEYTKVIGGRMLKVLSWYDNEWGYSCRVRDLIKYIAARDCNELRLPIVIAVLVFDCFAFRNFWLFVLTFCG